jgi:2-polyprenyl-3-methyl-5-hydroxy-6-metoxy-1,4-benzoquinol methylase
MGHQDFEKYAKEKPFNYKVPEAYQENFKKYAQELELPLAELKILDFGCGDGKHFKFFAEMGFSPINIYGVEVSRSRIERCHKIGWEKSYFIENETVLPFENDQFDIINMAEVIEHIPVDKIDKIFSDLVRVLKRGGFIIVTTPNYPIKRFYDLKSAIFYGKKKRFKDDPTHVAFYSTNKLGYFLNRYFNFVKIVPYKKGFIYKKIHHSFFMHKIMAIGANKK